MLPILIDVSDFEYDMKQIILNNIVLLRVENNPNMKNILLPF